MKFRLLGPFEAQFDDGRPITCRRRRERSVLALLLLDVDQVVPIRRLIQLLWDGEAPDSAHTDIQVAVSRLRGILAGTAATIHTVNDGYRLEADRTTIDVTQFRDAVAAASAVSDPARRVTYLDQALGLWRGPVLDGVLTGPSRATAGLALDEARLAAHEQRAEALLALGEHARVGTDLTELAAEHPTRERVVGLLMTALYRSQRQAEALALFRVTQTHLCDELGISPTPELTALHLRILRKDPALAAPTAKPQRVGGLDLLPTESIDFVGRDDMLTLISDRIAPGAPVVISGMSGVGKTSLAVRWARQHADRFPDGRLFINLRGYDPRSPLTPTAALTLLLGALGFPGDRIPDGEEAAANLFRSAIVDRAILLVLDNARSAEQVRPLLPTGSANAVVVTSRDTLAGLIARDGARPLQLDVLADADSTRLLDVLLASRPVDPPAARTALAKLCGHLPLALRIAAAHLVTDRRRSIDHFIEQLSTDARVETLDLPGDPDNALGTLFDQSFHTLEPLSQHVLLMLAAGPCIDYSEHAVAAMLDADLDTARACLNTLTSAHMMMAADGRYGFHDLVREYAQERAARDAGVADRDVACDRLVDWYGHLALQISIVVRGGPPAPIPNLRPPPDPMPFTPDLAAIDTFMDGDISGFTGVIRYGNGHGRADTTWRIVAALYPYLVRGRYGARALLLGLLGLDAALDVADPQAEWQNRNGVGVLYSSQRRPADGIPQHIRNLDIARSLGDERCEMVSLGNLGIGYRLTGQAEKALDAQLSMYERAGATAGPGDLANMYNNLTNCYIDLGDYHSARVYIDKALVTAREGGVDSVSTICLMTLGSLYSAEGDHQAALVPVQDGLDLARSIGHRQSEMELLCHLATAHVGLNDHAAAVRDLETALEVCRIANNPTQEVWILVRLAESHLACDDVAATRADVSAADALVFLADAEDQIRLGAVRRALDQIGASA